MLSPLDDCGGSLVLSRFVWICGTVMELVALRGVGDSTTGLGGTDPAGESAVAV